MIFPEEVKKLLRETYEGDKPSNYDHQHQAGMQVTLPMITGGPVGAQNTELHFFSTINFCQSSTLYQGDF